MAGRLSHRRASARVPVLARLACRARERLSHAAGLRWRTGAHGFRDGSRAGSEARCRQEDACKEKGSCGQEKAGQEDRRRKKESAGQEEGARQEGQKGREEKSGAGQEKGQEEVASLHSRAGRACIPRVAASRME